MDNEAFVEYKEGIKRWNSRQDKRIELLENSVEDLKSMSISIEKLATNMQNMLNEQVNQGKRLESLEAKDGEMWRTVVKYVISALVGLAIGYLFK